MMVYRYFGTFLISFLFCNFHLLNGKLFPIEPRHSLVENEEVLPDIPGSIWPAPNKVITFWSRKYLDPNNFRLVSDAIECDIILEALKRYNKLLFLEEDHLDLSGNDNKNHIERLLGLKVMVEHYDPLEGHCGYPQMDDDESYSLQIFHPNTYAKITSKTVWGALRGLETFSQVIYYDKTERLFLVNESTISDWPAFSHRGILLDTSRHYLNVDVIKLNLDAMSYNKFNVFHWHIVDDQSFPFQSRTYPNLSQFGAYTQKHIYTHDDITLLIEYARLRGIRIVPEFDSPSHTHSIGYAFPDLMTPCYVDGKAHVANGDEYSEDEVLNPILEETYDFVSKILTEFHSLFKDNYVHLGMDETNLNCWKSNPNIIKFIKDHGMETVAELHQYYSQRVLNLTDKMGYKYVIWEDPLENNVNVSKDTIIEVWKPNYESRAFSLVQRGYKVILSSCWYLNYISYGQDWKQYYQCDPADFLEDNTKYRAQVLGGEACMWGEYIDNNNLLDTLWPRASAVAERLWFNATKLKVSTVLNRLDRHRCRMLRRGIPTKPLLNGYCGEFEATASLTIKSKGSYLYQIVWNKVPHTWEESNFFLSMIALILVMMFILYYLPLRSSKIFIKLLRLFRC